jgi:hypothetical protein
MVEPVFKPSSSNVTRYVASPFHLDLSYRVFLPPYDRDGVYCLES